MTMLFYNHRNLLFKIKIIGKITFSYIFYLIKKSMSKYDYILCVIFLVAPVIDERNIHFCRVYDLLSGDKFIISMAAVI